MMSPHFRVVNSASASLARAIAAQFERVRQVFEKAFPALRVYPASPVTVLALEDHD